MKRISITCEGESLFDAALAPGEYLIGRDPDAAISIDHPTVSRHHARLIVGPNGIELTDLGSSSGSYIGEMPLGGPTSLYEGDDARLGGVHLAVTTIQAGTSPQLANAYQAGEMVARGGMGAIHLARQNAMERDVAMKVMLRAGNERARQRFINEARITGRLEHPNIPPVHELGTDAEGKAFYTMKFIRGTTLASVLEEIAAGNSGTLSANPFPSLLTNFQKVCDALAFAHSRHVIHRDLKPENIMLGDFGEVLVMDWGLAKELSGSPDAPAAETPPAATDGTLEGSIMGTPAYMSPEQARGEIANLDARSDIYALGAILHEILYLRPLVAGDNPVDIITRVGAGERDPIPRGPHSHLPGGRVPPSLRAIRRKALAVDPADRYARVEDLQADIAAYQTGFATGAENANLFTQLTLLLKRHRGISITAGTAAALLAIMGIWFTTHLIVERNKAETARKLAVELRQKAEDALALVEPARVEATRQRDRATGALAETESERQRASEERDRALKALAENEAIRERIAAALKQIQDSGDIFSALSTEYARSGRIDEALNSIEHAVDFAPQDPRFRVTKANLLQASGRFSQAVPEYRRALALRPNPQVAENLALTEMLEHEQGDATSLLDDVRTKLEAALTAQNREVEAILLAAATSQDPTVATAEEPDSPTEAEATPVEPRVTDVLAKLGAITARPAWSADRIKPSKSGGLALNLGGLEVSNLAVLRGTEVDELVLTGSGLNSISSLRGLPLRALNLEGNRIKDLSPLRGMPLRWLSLWDTDVSNLSPLAGMEFEYLQIGATKISSLKPLAGMTIQNLRTDSKTVTDFSAISTLRGLRELHLPPHASGIDCRTLTELEVVRHPRFQPSGTLDGKLFKRLTRLSDDAWKKWQPVLRTTGGDDLRPDRMTVRTAFGIDLDLRGTNVTRLEPLAKLPIHRLWIDTSTKALDLSPLAGMTSLRHLGLTGANVKSLRPVFPGSRLESLVMDASCPDILLLREHPILKHLGYRLDENTLLPDHTREEFFQDRIRERDEELPADLEPQLVEDFDTPPDGALDWKIVREDGWEEPVFWHADPPPAPGRGGGQLVAATKTANEETAWFQAPESLLGKNGELLGSLLEFQLAANHAAEFITAPDLVLASGSRKLIYTFPDRPCPTWTTYLVPIAAGPRWTVGSPDGPVATKEDFKKVLGKPDSLRIRADFSKYGDDITRIDDVMVWPADAAARRLEIENQRRADLEATFAWRERVEVSSDAVSDSAVRLGHPFLWDEKTPVEGHVWLHEVDGHQGVLMVRNISETEPATILYRIERPVPAGSTMTIIASGTRNVRPGVLFRVMSGDQILLENQIDPEWKTLAVPLPESESAGSEIVIEVHPIGNDWEIGYIDDIGITFPADGD